jgi:hypothetical protein
VGLMTSAEHPKTAALLGACTKDEQVLLLVLVGDSNKPIKIHHRMKFQYDKACLSLQQVYNCSREFKNGVSSIRDAT